MASNRVAHCHADQVAQETHNYNGNSDNNQEVTVKNIYSPDIYLVSSIKKQAYISEVFLYGIHSDKEETVIRLICAGLI
jgi:hypothetical protein